MAKVHGPLRLSGTIGEITFYFRNGKWFARQKSSLKKERVKTDPKFKRSMENMSEFGITASITKEIWHHLPKPWRAFRDPYSYVRYKAKVYEIIKHGPGNRGQKDWMPAIVPRNWNSFQFNAHNYFGTSCRPDLSSTWDPISSVLTLSLPLLVEELYTNPPAGSTHAKLTFAGLILRPYIYHTINKKWDPATEWQNHFINHTDLEFSLRDGTPLPPTLSLSFASTQGLPNGYSIQALLGITFMQEIGGTTYPLKEKASMTILNSWS